MHALQLYKKYSFHHKASARLALKKYGNLINWPNNDDEMVMDVGCGGGECTEEIILPILPENIKLLVGVDQSKEAIQVKQAENKNPKLVYKVMDIETKHIDDEFLNKFSYIFSFYCFQWVDDERQAYQNLHKMLKPGGGIFIYTLITNPILETIKKMNLKKPFKDNSENQPNFNEYKIRMLKILEATGFQVKLLEGWRDEVPYTSDTFKGLISSAEFMSDKVDFSNETFFNEMITLGDKMKFWKINPDKSVILNLSKVLIIAERN